MIAFSTLMVERAGGYREILPLKKEGLKNLELTWSAGVDIDDRESFLKAAAELKKAGIKLVSAHAPLHTANGKDVDISSPDRWKRKFAVRETQKSILAFSLMTGSGGTTVIHAGRAVENENRKEHIRAASESLAEICEFAAEYNTEICLENTLPGHLGCFLDELLEVREKSGFPGIKFCLDTGHYNLAGDQSKLLSEMAKDITELHIHDNDGSKDSHFVPGRGRIDWKDLFALITISHESQPLAPLNVFEIMRGGASEIGECLKFAADYGIQ
ncbi:MAG: sugar phosphate isomerase/epimerase family protein [Elusimicrobiota bacterium]|nr:sugar phosphate isomerase/epimerase family protein [Elusimicrobiota bacterium]